MHYSRSVDGALRATPFLSAASVSAFSLATLSLATMSLATPGPACAETLKDALAQAYRTNPTLTAARAGQRATDENVAIAKASARPSASATTNYQEMLQRPYYGYTSTPQRNITSQASVSVPIYQGGAIANQIKSAEENVKAGEQSLRGTEASIFSQVVATYLDVIRDTSVVSYNRQNVASLELNLQASKDRFEVGDLTRTDVAQSESRLSLARADLQSAEAQLITSKENYVALVGSTPDGLETPPPLPDMPDSAEGAVEVALKDNPDILAADRSRTAAHYNVRAAKATVMPRLSAFASGSYVDYLGAQKEVGLSYGSVKQAAAGLQLNLPIYQGGQPGARTRQSIALESQAIEQSIGVERSVIAQTRSAYASWQASLHAIDSTKKAVEAAQLSLEGVKAENSVGTRTVLDILNSQRDLINAQVQYVSAQRNAYVAGFTLLAAMGHAQASDLNLATGGPLYDPTVHYRQVRGKMIDFDFGAAPKPMATSTTGTPVQGVDPEPADNQ